MQEQKIVRVADNFKEESENIVTEDMEMKIESKNGGTRYKDTKGWREQKCNRAFQQMLAPARERLCHRMPVEIAEKAGAVFDPGKSVFKIQSMGQEIEIMFPSCEYRQVLDEWHHLVILHYLDLADGTPVSSQLVSFGSLKDGMIRGTKFDYTSESELRRFLQDKEPMQIQAVCEALGAKFVESKADLCAVFPFLPNYLVTMNVWFADDEFPASGRLFLCKNADHYLTIEDAVTVGEIILKAMADKYKKIFETDES